MLPAGIRRFFRLGRARDVAAEVDAEIAFHFEQKIEALVARGMSREDARDETLRQFGDPRAARRDLLRTDLDDAARSGRIQWRGDAGMDILHALRSLGRTPGLTAAIVLMLALGIGANAAMLGILDRLLLRPPPHLTDPETLARIVVTMRRPGRPDYARTIAPFAEVADYARAIGDVVVAGYSLPRQVVLGDGEKARRSNVTSRYFEVLGARPLLGRTLDSTDVARSPVAVISWDLWQGAFAADPGAIGREIRIDSVTFVVAGVMPRGFSGAEVDAADVWTLLEHGEQRVENWRTTRNTYWLELIARIPADDRTQLAQRIGAARLAVRGEALRPGVVEEVALASIIPGRRSTFRGAAVRLSVAVAVVSALLLLIAIANVANLLLVRAVSRTREYAVRAALGAGRGRLLRGVLTESLLLSLAGGVAAGLVGLLAGRGLRALLLPDYQWAFPPIGFVPAAFAAVVSLAIGLVTGLVPAGLAGRQRTLAALRTGVQQGRGARARVRTSLVAMQLAVSVMLLIGTGLFARSFARASHEDHGIQLARMAVAEVWLPGSIDARAAELEALQEEVRRVPGVEAVTVMTAAPMRRLDFASMKADDRDTMLFALSYAVPAGFFDVAGVRRLSGRAIETGDVRGAERIAIVDRVFESRYWPGGRAVGRCVFLEGSPDCTRIVGVVAHVRASGLADQPEPQIYIPLAQASPPPEYALMIRATDDANRILDPVFRVLERRIPDYSPRSVMSYDDMLEPQLRPWRVGMVLFGLAAGLALFLSSIGTYAVMAFTVRLRAHEFGVRRALGARAGHILRLVLGEGTAVALVGIATGVGISILVARYIGVLLYQVAPRDPLVMLAAGGTLMAAAILAALGAARQALRADPRQALQAD